MADLEPRVCNVSRCLKENSLTVSSYVGYVMSSKKLTVEKSSLAHEAVSICEIFYSCLPSHPSITLWALSIAKDALRQDVSNLAQAQHGLHFNAKHAASNYLEGSFMKEAASQMSKLVPNLWTFFEDLLGGASSRRRARAD